MPQAITSEMRHKIQHDRDTKYNVMKSLLYVALDAIGDVTNKIKHKERNERKEDIWNIMDSFVRLAVIIDAWKGYRDLLYAITHFDMAASPFLERRFFSLCENIEIIYQEVPNEDILYWQKPQQGRFTLENESLQVDACPSIINASKTHLVHFTNSLVTSYDDRLMAVCSALVLNDSQNAQHTNIFVVNLSNGSVERVGLLSDGEQKLIPDDNPEVQPEQWRRTPCEFLQSAVAFKMMPRPEEISVAAMHNKRYVPSLLKSASEEEGDEGDKGEDDTQEPADCPMLSETTLSEEDCAFIREIHEEIDAILAKQTDYIPAEENISPPTNCEEAAAAEAAA